MKWSKTEIKNIKEELAGRLGTTAKGIEISKLAVNPASPLLVGGISLDTITAYQAAGTAAAIGKLTTRGDLSSSTVTGMPRKKSTRDRPNSRCHGLGSLIPPPAGCPLGHWHCISKAIT